MINPDQGHFNAVADAIAESLVSYINDLMELDKPAIAAMFANRVPCNKALADHPTVQVTAQHGGYHVGLIGILNGLCGVREDGMSRLCLVWEKVDAGGEPELVGLALTPEVLASAPCDVPITVSEETEEPEELDRSIHHEPSACSLSSEKAVEAVSSTPTAEPTPVRQYFCAQRHCPARSRNTDDPECICWFDEGTGPDSDARYSDGLRLPWRDKPDTTPVS
jgi:hypothetical protein